MAVDPSDQLRAAVAAGAQDTPYQVIPTPVGFDLRINVVDARWCSMLGAGGLKQVAENRVALDEVGRVMMTTDVHLGFEWEVDVQTPGMGLPRLVASALTEKKAGRVHEFSSNRTRGIDQEGEPATVVNVTVSSAEGHRMIRTPSAEPGWKEKAGTAERIGWASVGLGLAVVLAVLAGVAATGKV